MNTPILPGLAPRIDVLTVTPAIAREWLARNTSNRNIRIHKADEFARDMIAGTWRMNGDTIRFAADGTLLDGQHRLTAVVKAGVSVQMIVVTGLANDTQATMDAGTKRTTADAFHLAGEKHAVNLAAVIRRSWAWKRGDHKLSMNLSPTNAESAAFLAANPALRRSAEISARVKNQYKYASAAVFGTAHFLFNEISPDDATYFAARLGDGACGVVHHPILTVRARLLANSESKKRIYEHIQLALYIQAWNAMRAGRNPVRFRPLGDDDPMPMPK